MKKLFPSRPSLRKSRLFIFCIILTAVVAFGISVSSHSGDPGKAESAGTPITAQRVKAAYRFPSIFTPLLPAPTVTVKMSDVILSDGPEVGKAGPGEKIQYTLTIQNTGSDASNVTVTDTVDPNTTYNSGSLNAAPVAVNDSYETIGNTLLEVGPVPSPNTTAPKVTFTGNILSNDLEFLGDTKIYDTVTQNPANGTVTVNSNGTFSYQPAANFIGTDTFKYRIKDAGGLTDEATVTITVKASNPSVANSTVWYVDNSAGGSAGTSSSPFTTLLAAQTAAVAGDTIYVATGSGTTGQNTGITLVSNERFIGAGVQLDVPVSVNSGPNPTVLKAAAVAPTITNAAGAAITIPASNPSVAGTSIRGFSIVSGGAGYTNGIAATFGFAGGDVTISNNAIAGGTQNAIDITTTNTPSGGGSATITNNTITAAGQEGIDINGQGSNGLILDLQSNAVTSTGNGIDINGTGGGTLFIKGFANNSVSGNAAASGIIVTTATFDSAPGTAALDTVSGGATVIGSAGNGVGAEGLDMSVVKGRLSFTDLDIVTSNGAGLKVSGAFGAFTGSAGTQIDVTSGASTIDATGGPAVDISGSPTIDLQFGSVKSAGSPTNGVTLSGVTGTFSAPTGSTIATATGDDFVVSGTGASATTITYNGTITNTAARSVNVQSLGASTTVTFGGAITDTGTGILLNSNNAASTITFSGGVALNGANAVFTATTNGTLNVTGTNTIGATSAPTGPALNVSSTTIGASGLTFQKISATGGTNGIILNNTGTTAGLTVTGNGGTCTSADQTGCSGGTIQNTTGADSLLATAQGTGILLNNTKNPSFTRINVKGNSNYGIRGSDVDGFTLANSVFNGTNGTTASSGPNFYNDSAILFDNPTIGGVGLKGSASITSTYIAGGYSNQIWVSNESGTLNRLTIDSCNIGLNDTTNGNDGISLEGIGSAVFNATIKNSTLTGAKGDVFQMVGNSSGNCDLDFDNNDVSNNHTAIATGGGGVTLSGGAGSGKFTINIHNGCTFRDSHTNALTIQKSGGTGSLGAVVDSATIGVQATANSGSLEGSGITFRTQGGGASTNATITVSNTQIYQYNNYGIDLQAGTGVAASGNFTTVITGNTINTPGNNAAAHPVGLNFHGIHLNSGVTPGDTFQTCAHISGNSAANSYINSGSDIRVRARQSTVVKLPGYGGGSGGTDTASVDTFLTGQNTVAAGGPPGGVTAAVDAPSTGFFGGAACSTTVMNQLELNNQQQYSAENDSSENSNNSLLAFLNSKTEFSSVSDLIQSAQVSSAAASETESRNNIIGAILSLTAEANAISAQAETASADIETGVKNGEALAHARKGQGLGSRLSGFMNAVVATVAPTAHAAAAPAQPAAPAPPPDIDNTNFGTLPAGESLVIVFDVTVKTPPVAQYSNQATVKFQDGAGPVQTMLSDDQPGTAAPDEPTITPGDRYDTGISLVTSSPGSSSFAGDNVTFTATVVASQGTGQGYNPANGPGQVQFFDNGVSIGTQNCNATVADTCTAQLTTNALSGGSTHPITAKYLGGTNHDPSALSNTVNQQVIACTSNPVVKNLLDASPVAPADSLRAAIGNVCPGTNITFQNGLTGQINLVAALPDIDRNMNIIGPGAGLIEVRGSQSGGGYRVFNITSAATDVTISGLTVNNGSDAVGGGGINNAGTLSLVNMAVGKASNSSGNLTAGSGGGIANSGTLTITNSTISNNTATVSGGGIFNGATGTLTVRNSTISKNTSQGGANTGGGIINAGGTVTLVNVTVAAQFSGGGVFNSLGTTNLSNTLIADNTTASDADIAGTLFHSLDYNLIENQGSATFDPSGTQAHDQVGTSGSPLDAKLGALADNGGPTFTHALLLGSPALEAATDAAITTLSADITTVGQTSISVNDASSIPARVGYTILIDGEQMVVTDKSGNTLTVTRGANSTTAATHSTGANLYPAFDQRGPGFLRRVDAADNDTVKTVDIGALEAIPTINDIANTNGLDDTTISNYGFHVGDAAVGIDSITASATSDPSGVIQSITVNNPTTDNPSLTIVPVLGSAGGTATITVTVNKTIAGHLLSMSDTFDVAIVHVNHAPVLITAASPTLTAVNEDAAVPSGSVGTPVSSLIDLNPPAGGLDNATDSDSGTNIGIAVVGKSGSGTWYFTTNNGVNWNTIDDGVSDTNAWLLAADAGNTRLYFRPAADYNGASAATITFRAWDQTYGANGDTGINISGLNATDSTAFSSASDTADITVNAVADITDDAATFNEDNATTINVLANDTFEDSTRTLTSFTQGTHGAVTRADNGTPGNLADDQLVYTPALDYNGSDSFTYTVTSGGVTETATVNVTINAVADIVAEDIFTNEDSGANDIDVFQADTFEDSQRALTSFTQGAHGTVTRNDHGTPGNQTDDTLIYTPNADYNGTDTFDYTVTPPNGTAETATETVHISAKADIVADNVTVGEDSGTNNLDLLANDTFEDSGRAITSVTSASHGTAAINNNGTAGNPADDFVTYAPDAGYNGSDTFNYTVTSGGVTETAAVNVTVNSINDKPTLSNVAATADYTENNAAVTLSPTISVADSDGTTLLSATVKIASGYVAGDRLLVFDTSTATASTNGIYTGLNIAYSYDDTTHTLTLTSATNPPGDTLANYAHVLQNVQFDSTSENPDNYGANTTRTITWQVQDAGGTDNGGTDLSDIGASTTTTLNIHALNDAPQVITNATLAVTSGATGTIDQSKLESTDADSNGTLTYTIGTAPAHGTLKKSGGNLSGGGTFTQADINSNLITYTHNGDAALTDSFTFTVSDGSASTSTTTFNITIGCLTNPVVTNTNDSGTGSLREALITACSGDTITFNIPTDGSDLGYDSGTGVTTITLTSGELLIDRNLTITGLGADKLTVKRSTAGGTPRFRIFTIAPGSNTINITGMTINNGHAADGLAGNPGTDGGAILNNTGATLNLKSVAITGSSAGKGGANGTGGNGGGIRNVGTLNLTNSTLSANTAGDGFNNNGGNGGGIYNSGTMTLTNTTISGNNAGNATIGGTGGDAGGIYNALGTLNLVNSTISNNTTGAGIGFPGGSGGGLRIAGGTVNVKNTIIAGNTFATGGSGPDGFGILTSQDYNLYGTLSGIGFTTVIGAHDLHDVSANLSALANNGGPTQTMLPLPGSPALNAIPVGSLSTDTQDADSDSNTAEALPVDQRGFARVVGTNFDIGAVEANYSIAATAGTPQSAVINTAFGTDLQATVKESNIARNNISVTFTAGVVAGATGSFPGAVNTANASTNSSGIATAPVFTANAIVGGPYNVTASIGTGLPTTTFALSNTKSNQTIIVTGHAPANAVFNTTFTVAATAGSGLGVVYGSSGACTNVGTLYTMTSGTGTCTVTYDQPGDSNWNPAPQVVETVTAQKAAQTITFGALSNKTFGDADFNVSATASSGLTVSFGASGQCTIAGNTVHITGAGSCTITASQAGNSNFSAAPDVPQSFTIGKANQTITFGALADKNFGDGDFTLSATASSGLPVSFSGTGSCTVSANAVHISNAGSCTITASQGGNANFNAAPNVQQSFNINKAATTTVINSSVNPSTPGQSVTFTALVTSGVGTPTGTIQFKDGATDLGTVAVNASGIATVTTNALTPGNHAITATYNGDANFNTSTVTLTGGQSVAIQTNVSINNVSLAEGNAGTTNFVFTVTLSQASNVIVKVDFATANVAGGATAGSDYTAQTGTLTFNPGDLTQNITIAVNGDTANEPDEQFKVNLSNAQNVNITPGGGTGTILNDDAPGVQFGSASYNINEGANNTPQGFTTLSVDVVRTGDLTNPMTVKYATADQSGGNECDAVTGFASQRCDYTMVGATLRFAAGEGTKNVIIPITNDGYKEGNELFTIQLKSPVGGTLGAINLATITISDDAADATPTTPAQNPYLSNSFFVRQDYLDNLGRDADQAGFTDWVNVLNNCGPQQGFLGAPPDCDRAHVAHGFFGSVEFTNSGLTLYRLYVLGRGRLPLYKEFIPDMATLSGFNLTPAQQQQNMQDYLQEFSSAPEFINRFQAVAQPNQAEQLIQMLEQTAGVTLPATTTTLPGQPQQYGRQELINLRFLNQLSLVETVKAFGEQKVTYDKLFGEAEVSMLYFAYLRRDPSLNDPNLIGWNNWVNVYNNGGTLQDGTVIQPRNIHHLIFGFIYSTEYRKRFGAP
jgi:hypothetical protein